MPRWMVLGLVAILAALLPAVTATAGEGDAVEAFARGDYVAARRELAPLGQAGDRDSQFYLGLMFRDGRGVPADSDTADLWFRLAASRGHLPSMVALGELGLRGVTSEAQADPALALVDAAVWLTLAVPLLPAGPDRDRVAAELQGLRPQLAAAQAIEVGRRTAR